MLVFLLHKACKEDICLDVAGGGVHGKLLSGVIAMTTFSIHDAFYSIGGMQVQTNHTQNI
jgi:hypothetical protein